MIPGKSTRRLFACLVAFGWLLMPAAGSPVEKRITRITGAPDMPADTAVRMRTTAAGGTEEMAARPVPPGPLKITITEAILLCLENNRSLVVQRLTPSIQQTFEDQEKAVFDPAITAGLSAGRVKEERLSRTGPDTEDVSTTAAGGIISLSKYFPTGTTVSLEAGTQMEEVSLYDEALYSTRLGMTVSQALLQGYGSDVNLARLQQARLDTRWSEYELRGFTAFLVAEVERAYWDTALARRQIEIVEESLKVARQQRDETKALIAVGRLAKSELAAVQAEVAAQNQALIEAQANKESRRLQLLRLLNPAGPGLWQREIDLIHQPTLPDITLDDIEVHVAVAMRMRPILNQARLNIASGDLEIVKTRNGLLPVMDLFITLGKSGYANSFGQSFSSITDDNYDALAGIRFNYPVSNRDANALHRRAQLTREQAQKALENLTQLVEVDLRTAFIEVNRTKQQIAASAVTRKFDEEKSRTETEKLQVGKSTSFLVAQAQRDLLGSRIAEVRALANYLKALIDFYRQDGSLLERRGISAPGREPFELSN
ncbi:MAG: TolC family protein [Pseudomonadota bacterium]